MRTLSILLLMAAAAMAGAPISDVRLSGSSQVASGTLTIQPGAALVSASGSAIDLSPGTVTFGVGQVPWSAVATSSAVFAGDSGTGGAAGLVPAPAAGAAAAGKVLTASGTWGAPVTALSALSDVTITSASNTQVLTYNGTAGKWVNSAVLVTGLADPTTTKGDLIVRGTASVDRVAVGSNGDSLIADSSQATGVRWQSPAAAIVTRSSNQSISNSSLTAVTFDTDTYDPLDWHSTSSNTSRITVARAGTYVLCANVLFDGSTTGDRGIYLQVNGSRVAGNYFAGSATEFSCTAIARLNSGDYVECLVFQNSGAALNVSATAGRSPKLSVVQLGN